jgi:hypothetical protein
VHGRWSTEWYAMSAAADSYLISKIRTGMTAAGVASLIGAPVGPGQPVALAMSIGVLILTACQQANGWAHVHWIGGPPPVGGMVCNPFA